MGTACHNHCKQMAKDNPTVAIPCIVIQEAVLTKEMLATIVARSVHDVISSHTSVFVEYWLLA